MRDFSMQDVLYMQMALSQAQIAAQHQDVPVGAVIVNNTTGEVVAVGHNTKQKEGMVTGHAEINAIMSANHACGNWRLSDCTLYVTLEPCPMCAGAILAARIPRVVCGAKDSVAGAMGSVWSLHSHPLQNQPTQVEFGCMAEEAGEILKAFFAEKR